MGFEFAPQQMLDICGKKYPIDITDISFIQGVVVDFARIFDAHQELCELRNQLTKSAQGKEELFQRMLDINRDIAAHAQNFIAGALGAPAFEDIFGNRRPSVADLVNLCGYIYQEALRGREKLLQSYLNPPHKPKKRRRHVNTKTAISLDSKSKKIPD